MRDGSVSLEQEKILSGQSGRAYRPLPSVCVFGYNIWSAFQPLGEGSAVLDLEDFIVSNILLPVGSLVYLLFCVTKWGWGYDKYLQEANKGRAIRMPRWLKPYFQFVVPVLILVILIQGLL